MLALFASAGTYRREAALKVTFVALAFVDLLLTLGALSQGFRELNPVVLSLYRQPVALALVKGFIPLLIAWLVPGKLLVPSIAAFVGITGWNLAQMVMAGVP